MHNLPCIYIMYNVKPENLGGGGGGGGLQPPKPPQTCCVSGGSSCNVGV